MNTKSWNNFCLEHKPKSARRTHRARRAGGSPRQRDCTMGQAPSSTALLPPDTEDTRRGETAAVTAPVAPQPAQWQLREQQQRHSLGHQHGSCSQLSDSELSEASDMNGGSLSRSSSSTHLKRSFGEASDSSDPGTPNYTEQAQVCASGVLFFMPLYFVFRLSQMRNGCMRATTSRHKRKHNVRTKHNS